MKCRSAHLLQPLCLKELGTIIILFWLPYISSKICIKPHKCITFVFKHMKFSILISIIVKNQNETYRFDMFHNSNVCVCSSLEKIPILFLLFELFLLHVYMCVYIYVCICIRVYTCTLVPQKIGTVISSLQMSHVRRFNISKHTTMIIRCKMVC